MVMSSFVHVLGGGLGGIPDTWVECSFLHNKGEILTVQKVVIGFCL